MVGKGNFAELPDGDVILAFGPRGTLTLGQLTGGRFKPDSLNPVTCAVVENVINANVAVSSGTGIFAATTGNFKVDALITGTTSRNVTSGACDPSGIDIEDTVQASALGNINLHWPGS